MKSRIPPKQRYSKTVVRGAEELVKERELVQMRRFFKLMCLVLNEKECGQFGRLRLMRIIMGFNKLLDKSKKDTLFWYHADSRLNQMGMNFEDEPEDIQLGKDYISEEDRRNVYSETRI